MDSDVQNRARWLRFSLRVLLGTLTLVAVCLGLWILPAERQRQAVVHLQAMDSCEIYYSYDPPGPYPDLARQLDPSAVWRPPFPLADWIGPDLFHGVTTVILPNSEVDAALPQLHRLRSLREVYVFDHDNDEEQEARMNALLDKLRKELPGVQVEEYHWHGMCFSFIPVVG